MVRHGRRLEWWGGPVPVRVDVSEPMACFGDPTVKVTAAVDILGDVAANDDKVLELIALRNMKASVGALAWILDSDVPSPSSPTTPIRQAGPSTVTSQASSY